MDDAAAAPAPGGAGNPEELTVAVVSGGLTHERDVSIRSGRRVGGALRSAGARVEILDLDGALLERLAALDPDVVWPVVHGAEGEDGSLQDLLGVLGLPFVGSSAAGARLASDKPVSKAVLEHAGVATPSYVALPQSLFREVGPRRVLDAVVGRLGMPLVVKPAAGGSALGVTLVEDRAQLPGAMVACFAYGPDALIERAVDGTEVAVSVVDLGDGPVALPPVEIATSDGPYDFDARYNPGRAEFFVPARLSADVAAEVARTATTVHTALGLRDLSRIDLIVDHDGRPWVIDINVAPGMTETSLFPQAASKGPTTAEELYLALARRAVERGANG
ncbi:D-alanine--D-alanine ligase family protein [Georgenia sp. Z1344]|uniref:D-alanine--D-alanine ligase family protein n=1 Tax=Georgenia sp. Z1344 TaxID=3416706 RepID=UPI003CF4B3F5